MQSLEVDWYTRPAMVHRLSPEQMKSYRDGAKARLQKERQELAHRRRLAWETARQAAEILKRDYGATRVVLFGSLLHEERFGQRSDIDLAAGGIAPESFWRAWCALDRMESGFEIELCPLESTKESLKAVLDNEGIEL
jgi:uncharacterized protein